MVDNPSAAHGSDREIELAARAHEKAPMLGEDTAGEEDMEPLSMDNLFEISGGFGRSQQYVLAVALWAWIAHGAQVMLMVFVAPGVTEEFDDQPTLMRLAGSFFFAGWFCGLGMWGWLAGKRGWLHALFLIEIGVIVTGCYSALATSGRSFVLARFLCGFVEGGVPTVSFGWAIEFATPHHKAVIGTTLQCGFVVGSLVVTAFSFFLPGQWRAVSGLVSLMPLPIVIAALQMPESPRWLMRVSKDENDWKQALLRVAAINGHWSALTAALNSDRMHEHKGRKGGAAAGSLWTLLEDGPLRRMSAIVSLQWFVIASSFFGLSLVASSLPGGAHANILVSAVCQLPALGATLCALKRCGRKSTILALLVTVGSACSSLACLLGALPTVRVALALVGSTATGSAFSSGYIFTGEVFPTTVRSAGLSAASQAARVGAFFSPVVLLLRDRSPALPFAVWGALALAAALATVLLPETAGAESLETVHDLHRLMHRSGCSWLLGSKAVCFRL